MFLFYLRGKSRRGDGGHVQGAQVGSDKGLCPLYFRVGTSSTSAHISTIYSAQEVL